MPSVFVSEINVYPVKSCRGIPLRRADLDRRGIRHDRRWMITGRDGGFLTQREHPRLSLIRTSIENDSIRLSSDGISPLLIPGEAAGADRVTVNIWKDTVSALSCGAEADEWISAHLQVPARIVYMPDNSLRPVNPRYALNKELTSFTDGFPLLLLSEASLADLNSRLESPVPMNRFRPNVVVTGCGGFAEDTWKTISIGPVRFRVAKPCSRCVITTVDQNKGVKGTEPLRTLSTYRNFGGDVNFGQNLIHQNPGTIRVGDEVAILS